MKKAKDLNKLTFSELKKEVELLQQQKEKTTRKKVGVWEVGENYFFRTVTMALTGKLIEVTDKEFVLESASWIADTGRFSDFLKSGKVDEVEPFPDGKVIIGRGGLIDSCKWLHALPREKK